MSLLDAARRLGADVGPVIPVDGKIPLLKQWPSRATRKPEGEPEWGRATGVGLVTGAAAGYVVLDVDGPVGAETLARWEREHGKLPATWVSRTGGGGLHYFFRHPGFLVRGNAGKLGPGIDIRGEGGFVVAPPSWHSSGSCYIWDNDRSPWEVELADATPWLLEKLRPAPRIVQPAPIARNQATDDVPKRARAYLNKIPAAVSGSGGHDQTFKAALALVRGFQLGEQDAFAILWNEYNGRCEPPWTEKELRHKIEDASRDASVPWGYLLQAPAMNGAAVNDSTPIEPVEKEAETGFASSYVFVRVQNKYVCRTTGYEISREALNSAHAREVTEIGYQLPDGRGGTRRVTKAHQLVDHYAEQADDLGWWPGKAELYEHQGRTLVNSFKAPPVPPLDRPDPVRWLEHLAWLIPQEPERKHLLDVLAYNVQHLGGKVNHAVVIGGKVRTGKDLAVQPVRKWFNANGSAWRDAKTEELDGQFTEYLHRTKILCVQESRDLSFETGFHRYNSFKTIIAAPPDELRIGVKFLRDFKVPNLVQVIILTNYPNGVYFEEKDDGRYFVTWSPVERRDDAYYTALADWIEAHYLDVIGYLARRDLQHFNPKALPPHTGSREKMHTATRSGAELTLAEVVGDVLEQSAVFTRQDLITRAKNMCHRGLESLLENRVRVGKVLDDLGCESREVRREGKDVRVYYKRGEVTAEQAGDLFRKRGMP